MKALRGTTKMLNGFRAGKPQSKKTRQKVTPGPVRTELTSQRYCFKCGSSHSTQYVGCPTCRQMQQYQHPELVN